MTVRWFNGFDGNVSSVIPRERTRNVTVRGQDFACPGFPWMSPFGSTEFGMSGSCLDSTHALREQRRVSTGSVCSLVFGTMWRSLYEAYSEWLALGLVGRGHGFRRMRTRGTETSPQPRAKHRLCDGPRATLFAFGRADFLWGKYHRSGSSPGVHSLTHCPGRPRPH